MKKKAFTLAEMLISLGIIGIIAAMTIPQLVKNYQMGQFKAMMKVDYEILSKVVENLNRDYDGIGNLRNLAPTHYYDMLKYSSDWLGLSNGAQYGQLFLTKYLSSSTLCTGDPSRYANATWKSRNNLSILQRASADLCWSKNPSGAADSRGLKLLNGTINATYFAGTLSAVVYQNGSLIMVNYPTNDIYIDANGIKPPNTLGKDIYAFTLLIKDDRGWGLLVPYDADPATTCVENSTAAANTGLGCAKKYILE